MTYISNTLTDASAPSVIASAMHTALLAEGYTLEDTVVIATRTHKVYLSPAGGNAEGLDWYLDVAYTTTGTGSIWLGTFETYDKVAHTAGLGPYDGSGVSPDPVEFSRYGAAKYALETNWTHVSGNAAQIETQATAMAYWISITPDRVIAMTSTNAVKVVYAGHVDPYVPWKTKCAATAPGKWNPLAVATINGPNAFSPYGVGVVQVTRHPPVATVYGSFDCARIRSSSSSSSSSVGGVGVGGVSGHVDTGWAPYLAGGPLGERIQITLLRDNSSWGGYGHAAGHLHDVARFGTSAATSVTRGDTVTIDGDTWVLASATGGACFGFAAI